MDFPPFAYVIFGVFALGAGLAAISMLLLAAAWIVNVVVRRPLLMAAAWVFCGWLLEGLPGALVAAAMSTVLIVYLRSRRCRNEAS